MINKTMLKKAGAVAMAMAITASLGAPALAEGKTYAPIAGANTVTFEKYLTMDKEANVPNAKFNYTIVPGEAQNAAADGSTLQVYAGLAGATIAADQAVFAPGDETFDTVQPSMTSLQSQHSDGTNPLQDAVTLTEGKKYARKAVTIDFANVNFREPGVYRYVVTEKAGDGTTATGVEQLGITNDADPTRILDVYVIDDGVDVNGVPKMVVQGYVLHNTEADATVAADGSSATDTKADGYSNDYETENLTLSKSVSGNQASRDEYFEFTVNITGAVPGTVYDVVGDFDLSTKTNAINTEAHTNPARLTADASGAVNQVFWLQHGQTITINGLAKGTGYSVKENATTVRNEGYAPSATITGDTKTGANDATDIAMIALNDSAQVAKQTCVEDSAIKADTAVAYVNAKSGTIPTGVAMTISAGAIVTLIGGLGVAGVTLKSRKKEEEDEE